MLAHRQKGKRQMGLQRGTRVLSVDTVTRLRAVIQFPAEATDSSNTKCASQLKGTPCLLFNEHKGAFLQE
jgi:hypothetical protein